MNGEYLMDTLWLSKVHKNACLTVQEGKITLKELDETFPPIINFYLKVFLRVSVLLLAGCWRM